MTMSPYWVPSEPQENHWSRQQSFHYRRGDNAIYLLTRTRPLEAEETERFREVMIGGPHEILVDEWRNMRPVVGEQVDSHTFALKSADVRDWNGKLVIVTEGTFTDFGLKAHSIFVDADDDGRFIEEIVYQAPTSLYKDTLNEAMLALQSIEWKTHSRW